MELRFMNFSNTIRLIYIKLAVSMKDEILSNAHYGLSYPSSM